MMRTKNKNGKYEFRIRTTSYDRMTGMKSAKTEKNPSFANVFVSDKHRPQRRFALSNTMKPLGALWVWTKRYQDKWATTNTLKLYLSVLLTLGK